MSQKIFCDRCQREISFSDERISDFLAREYPGKHICQNCDLEITLAMGATKADIEKNLKPGTSLKLMGQRYGIITDSDK